jgi:hypothetical protein
VLVVCVRLAVSGTLGFELCISRSGIGFDLMPVHSQTPFFIKTSNTLFDHMAACCG